MMPESTIWLDPVEGEINGSRGKDIGACTSAVEPVDELGVE